MLNQPAALDRPTDALATARVRKPLPHAPRLADIPRLVWACAALAVAVRVGVALATHFTSEDFLITLRYADNLAAGRGFTYNPPEHVLGTTTPLYTLLLAGLLRLGLPAVGIGKALNILADGALCLVVYQWLARAGQQRAGILAALWVAIQPLHVRWAISGMETSLVTLCGAWVWLCFMRRQYARAYGALGVLFLLRWDSVLLLAVLTAAIVWRERRLPWRELALYAMLITPWLSFAWRHFGSPIPVTGAAKMTVYGWHAHGLIFPQLHSITYRLFGNAWYAAVTALAGVGLWQAWRTRWRSFAPAVAWLTLWIAALVASKILVFEWYLVPPLPVYGALAALGAAAVWAWLTVRRPSLRQPAMMGAAALACALGVVTTRYSIRSAREMQRVEDHLRRPLGIWLRAHTAPADRIMLEPIGYIGYYSGRPILDSVGLVTPEVLRCWTDAHAAPLLDIARAFRPEWVVLRPAELAHVQGVARAMGTAWERDYRLVQIFTYSPPDRPPVTFIVYRRRG